MCILGAIAGVATAAALVTIGLHIHLDCIDLLIRVVSSS